jgi:hypothetical protein
MQTPASNHHINDAMLSAQPVAHSQTSLHPESTTWLSQPGPCKEAIQTGHVGTCVFGLPDWDEIFR